jgi:diguanylate cyclase (GGDEF)-like protein
MEIKTILGKYQTKGFLLWAYFLLIGILGSVDYLTGYELAFSPFYLFPIFGVAWLSGYTLGFAAAITSALVWLLADIASGHIYSRQSFYFLNTGLRLLNYAVVVVLAARLKRDRDQQNLLARRDPVTGIANARACLEFLQIELARAKKARTALSLIYIDLDNFKLVNDRQGHTSGDKALADAARIMRESVRSSDFLARMGGDEFAVILPETGAEQVKLVSTRLRERFAAEMARLNWDLTCSMGIVTAESAEQVSPEALLKQADNLMYQVKQFGKNNYRFAMYGDEEMRLAAVQTAQQAE